MKGFMRTSRGIVRKFFFECKAPPFEQIINVIICMTHNHEVDIYFSKDFANKKKRSKIEHKSIFVIIRCTIFIYTFRIGDKNVTKRECSKNCDRDDLHAYAPYSKALHRELDRELKNNCQVYNFNGRLRSCSSLATELT